MDHRVLRMLGFVRLAAGAWLVVQARASAALWTGEDSRPVRAVVRSVGARDAVLGAGLLATPSPPWLAASVLSDVADGVFARELPADRRRLTRALAFGSAAAGIAAGAAMRRGARGVGADATG